MFNVGWFTAAAGIWRRDDDLDRQARFPIPAYLIETDVERILIDTGLHPGAGPDAARHDGSADALAAFGLELEQSIADQVDLETITKVDPHAPAFRPCGRIGADAASSVPVVVQRREWEAGRDRAAIARNFYMPLDYAIDSHRVTLVDGDHDLLGDGSIELLLSPGHTPGHQSIRIGDRLIIGADVSHDASGLDDHRFPLFADDFDAQAASADRLRILRDAGVTVLPGHDPEALKPGPVLV